ncbi:TPA_asm: P6 [Artemisia betacytorhabdovirus 1]|nr:TPA_asm: P6 [Artemisia betacytorhabdovirus 1]
MMASLQAESTDASGLDRAQLIIMYLGLLTSMIMISVIYYLIRLHVQIPWIIMKIIFKGIRFISRRHELRDQRQSETIYPVYFHD